MKKTTLTQVDLVIEAMMKLDHESGERQNVLAFIQSCYCGLVRDYSLEGAEQALTRLSPEEQHALIEYQMRLL
jgi:hypothetical protein